MEYMVTLSNMTHLMRGINITQGYIVVPTQLKTQPEILQDGGVKSTNTRQAEDYNTIQPGLLDIGLRLQKGDTQKNGCK
jgi:hypothetical protein